MRVCECWRDQSLDAYTRTKTHAHTHAQEHTRTHSSRRGQNATRVGVGGCAVFGRARLRRGFEQSSGYVGGGAGGHCAYITCCHGVSSRTRDLKKTSTDIPPTSRRRRSRSRSIVAISRTYSGAQVLIAARASRHVSL